MHLSKTFSFKMREMKFHRESEGIHPIILFKPPRPHTKQKIKNLKKKRKRKPQSKKKLKNFIKGQGNRPSSSHISHSTQTISRVYLEFRARLSLFKVMTTTCRLPNPRAPDKFNKTHFRKQTSKTDTIRKIL